MSNVRLVARYGQSIWYDNISRAVLRGGALARMVAEDGIAGVTSNPTIFMKAIAEGGDYDEDIRRLKGAGKTAEEIVHHLTMGDIREAAELLRPVYEKTAGLDGYISLECDPHLAHDAPRTVDEAVRLFREVGRPNLMIKVPGTVEGVAAARELLVRGVNVNITLLFAPEHYRRVAVAYIEALEARRASGQPPGTINSVASFFLSRIDTVVDLRLNELAAAAPAGDRERFTAARGQAAVAVAKVTYGIFRELFLGDRFRRLAEAGAAIQRPLWASTGTKDPAYSDVKYVEALIGPHTVNTLPQATLDAFRDHGRSGETITAGLEEARGTLSRLAGLGVDLDALMEKLQTDGVKAFVDSWEALKEAVRIKMSR